MLFEWAAEGARFRRESFTSGLRQKFVNAQSAGPHPTGDNELETYFDSLRRKPEVEVGMMHALCRADYDQLLQSSPDTAAATAAPTTCSIRSGAISSAMDEPLLPLGAHFDHANFDA